MRPICSFLGRGFSPFVGLGLTNFVRRHVSVGGSQILRRNCCELPGHQRLLHVGMGRTSEAYAIAIGSRGCLAVLPLVDLGAVRLDEPLQPFMVVVESHDNEKYVVASFSCRVLGDDA